MVDPTLDDAARITDLIYSAAFDDAIWRGAMDDFRDVLGLSTGSIAIQDFRSNTLQMLVGDCDPHYAAVFMELGEGNVYTPWMTGQAAGSVTGEADWMDRHEFERSAYFADFMAPQGEHYGLVGRAFGEGATLGGYVMMTRNRGQSGFDQGDRSFLTQLLPALGRVTRIRRQAGVLQLQQRADTLQRLSVGLVVTDRQGRILQTNGLADETLASTGGLVEANGRLLAQSGSENEQLLGLIQAAVPMVSTTDTLGGEMLVTAPLTGAPAYSLSIRPVPHMQVIGLDAAGGALVLIQALGIGPRAGFEERTRTLFSFTPREASLARALAAGQTLRDAADERGISMPTARTQLAQLFRKTNTTQQSQLVALLLGILPVA